MLKYIVSFLLLNLCLFNSTLAENNISKYSFSKNKEIKAIDILDDFYKKHYHSNPIILIKNVEETESEKIIVGTIVNNQIKNDSIIVFHIKDKENNLSFPLESKLLIVKIEDGYQLIQEGNILGEIKKPDENIFWKIIGILFVGIIIFTMFPFFMLMMIPRGLG